MEAAIEGGRTRAETNRWLVLVLVCIARFIVRDFDATIVDVALPSMQHQACASRRRACSGSHERLTRSSSRFLLLGRSRVRPARATAPLPRRACRLRRRLADQRRRDVVGRVRRRSAPCGAACGAGLPPAALLDRRDDVRRGQPSAPRRSASGARSPQGGGAVGLPCSAARLRPSRSSWRSISSSTCRSASQASAPLLALVANSRAARRPGAGPSSPAPSPSRVPVCSCWCTGSLRRRRTAGIPRETLGLGAARESRGCSGLRASSSFARRRR